MKPIKNERKERQIIPIAENINRYSEKYLKGIGKNNYSGSQKQLHPIGENDRDIINNIKNKNNYNKELHIKKNNKANFEQRDYTGFDLQRGLPKEETNREHYSVEEYKKITNFKQTKEILNNMKLELPDIPDITDININRLSKKRDEKIIEEIIKPKDNVIQNLYQDNMNLHMQLSRQAQAIEEAEKYQKERDKIIADNEKLHNEVDNIKTEYNKKEFDMEWKYTNKINKLEKENNFLHKVVDRFKETIDIFITWICKKFDMGAENNLIRDFERENNIMLDAEKQIKHEEREKDLEMER